MNAATTSSFGSSSLSTIVKDHHLTRKAVIYIRQSTEHQVLSNQESALMQRAMRDHALKLGWPEPLIEIIESDTGQSGRSRFGREGFNRLRTEILLGTVGIVLSYESARLSRNCSDWYPLLDACGWRDCLVADRDGVYDPRSPAGRLHLGIKGVLSEYELHSLRGRLMAGMWNKASRGELVMKLPAGFERLEDGRVEKDPDLRVQGAIDLVFTSFAELRSASKVARRLRDAKVKIPRRSLKSELQWCNATSSMVASLLRNPAYTGAFVFGRTTNRHELTAEGVRLTRQRKPQSEWLVLKDHHPSYISWENYEQIQETLADNRAEYRRQMTRGIARDGDALLQGIVYCGECAHKMNVAYHRRGRYRCIQLHQEKAGEICQDLLAEPIDRAVTAAFFEALSPVEVDLYELAVKEQLKASDEIRAAQERELKRLRYESDLARRQYDRTDPDNRLVASELERRWEMALRALKEAELQFGRAEREREEALRASIPSDVREGLRSLGKTLPSLWEKESFEPKHKKTFLRALIEKVVLMRARDANGRLVDHARLRIVWKGSSLTELEVPLHVGALETVRDHEKMEQRIRELEAEKKSDEEIAAQLSAEGFRSPRGESSMLPSTVRIVRLRRLKRVHRYRKSRDKSVAGYLTVPQIARLLGVNNEWVQYRIKRGLIPATKSPGRRPYLLPDTPENREALKTLLAASKAPHKRNGAST
jgi:DNA invertase Pin-like site-specific DNA recombinase